MGYQGEGEGEVGREMAWLVGRKVDMSGQAEQAEQAEQEFGKCLGGKDEREIGKNMG